jgi:hypothetical protein
MVLEKNPQTRPVMKRLLQLEDKILGMPFPSMKREKQINSDYCGPAVITTLYSFLGVKTSQRKIVASIRVQNKIKNFGLNIKDLARASKIAGKGAFSFWKKANSKVSDLDLAINKYKSPVGIEWQGVFYEDEDDDSGHFSIITKIDKNLKYSRIADPYKLFTGVDRKFGIKEFEKRWWDENVINRKTILDKRVMFLITPKGDSWPKKLGMTKA